MATSAQTHLRIRRIRIHDHEIIMNEVTKTLIVDDFTLPCTPIEYGLFITLSQGSYVSLGKLVEQIWQSPLDRHLRRRLSLHISRLRDKTLTAGLDITCLRDHGYMLVPWTQEPGQE
jgi:DNA-binding response OmpR family regulator